ncbi:MAG: hypothetical protein WBW74_20810 [Xanthobacteraceae bacterium]
MDYLVYAYLQMGQDAKAQAVIEEMRGIGGFTETFIAGPYALAVSPARYARIVRWPAEHPATTLRHSPRDREPREISAS